MRDHALMQIAHSVDRTSRLVRQMLDLARQEGRATAGSGHPVALRLIVDDVVRELGPLAQARGVKFEVSEACHDLQLTIEPDALRLALRNLIENALHHGGSGGFVHVECEQRDGLELRVVDGGTGIPSEDAQRLLRRFERGAGVAAHGSGLGLSIVEPAIEPAGGTLELRDRKPQGLAAILHFPRRAVVS